MKFNLIAGAILSVPVVASAASELPFDVSLDSAIYSKYVWRGVNLSNGGVFQPSLTVGLQGFELNVWGSYEFTNNVLYPSGSNGKNRFTEWDTTLSYSGESALGSWTVGAVQYAYPTTGLANTTEVFAQFGFNHPLNPYIAGYFDVDESKGTYLKLGGSTNLSPLSQLPVELNFWVGYGDKKNNDFTYGNARAGLADYGLEAKVSTPLGKNGTLWTSVGFTSLFDSKHLEGSSNRSNVIVGFGYGLKF
ncbi:MAG: hypothetical protein KF824_00385 [Fimbriimonadaceae bacterium]|nr:MAG: hypothetical protein KF824_00385 [Fimbriimonadaceae bacterium]